MKQVEAQLAEVGFITGGYSQVENEQKETRNEKETGDREDEDEKIPSEGDRRWYL